MAWGDFHWDEAGTDVVEAYWDEAATDPVEGSDRMGNLVSPYGADGYRKRMWDADGNEIYQYEPDGTQIPLYDFGGNKLTNDEVHPDAPGVPAGDTTPTDPEPTDPEPTDPEPTDPEPTDPEPTDPEPLPDTLTATRLKAFMAGDVLTDDQAEIALASAVALIEGYTRGNHVDSSGAFRSGIETVALTVAARLAANPGQITKRDAVGPFSQHRGVGFTGFTLAELAVLNRYRKRATG